MSAMKWWKGTSAAVVLAAGVALGAHAAGLFPGFPAGVAPFSGNEQFPADTGLAGGSAPQTETITLNQLKAFLFGNGGTSTGTNGTATAVAGAATLNSGAGTVTSEALTTAAAADYTLTLTDSTVTAGSVVLVSVGNGTNTTPGVVASTVAPAAGSVVIKAHNAGAVALNGTIKINFLVVN